MQEQLAVALAVIVVAGVGAQWLASVLRVSSVLILLPAGMLVGPVLDLVDPQVLFGETLFTLVAIGVGLILFEGGVELHLDEAGGVSRTVIGLVTVGAAITWLAGGTTAALLFDMPTSVAFLLGAILVVSGPTVVLPLLEAVRLQPRVASILRWECIVIDPIGAVLAVAVFEAILDVESGFNPVATLAVGALVGVATGLAAGFGLAALLRVHAIPDRLHNGVTLATVVGCFVVANQLSVEAGLFATTVMGIVLVNQRLAPVAHITAFGEDIGALVLGGLFILLGAVVDFEAMGKVLLPSLGLLVVLLCVRPAAVWISTLGAGLRARDRWFLSLVAPRGIVAAAVAALFSASLVRNGTDGAAFLAPATFVVVIGSVLFTSLVARPAAHRLRVDEPPPQGVLMAGDQPWVLDASAALAAHGVPVLVVPTDDDGAGAAAQGLLAYTGPPDDDELADAIDGVGVGLAVVATMGQSASTFLVERLSELLGRRNVYRVDHSRERGGARRSRSWGLNVFDELARPGGDDDAVRWAISELPGDAFHNDDGESRVVPLFVLQDDGPPAVVVQRRRSVPTDATVIVAEPALDTGGPTPPDPPE